MSFTLSPGTPAPDFSLPGTDGKVHYLADFQSSPVVVVGFTCNHCPYVVGSEDRIIELARIYQPRGVAFVLISSNDAENYPEDNFEKMVQRATDKGFPFPYLYDESQQIAANYGAIKTPQFFVLDSDRIIRYLGRMDDNPKDAAAATTGELRDAIEDLLNGRAVAVPQTDPIGCTIKWRGKGHKFIPADKCDVIFKR